MVSQRRHARRPTPSTLERAVIASVKNAEWLTESDRAAVWLLRDLTLILDGVVRGQTLDGSPAPRHRDIAELAGRTLQLFRELGLTPVSRWRLGLFDNEQDDAFAEVVRIASGAAAGDASD